MWYLSKQFLFVFPGKKKLEDFDIPGVDMEAFIKVFNGMDDNDELFEIHQIFVEKALGFAKGQNGILLNGRIIGPFSEKETFGDDDFNLLDRFRYDEKSNINPF